MLVPYLKNTMNNCSVHEHFSCNPEKLIGNDIVHLTTAAEESNWKRTGYLEKIFTEDEQQIILHASHPLRSVWSIWAMKEAVYKAHYRKTKKWEYAPSKIRCQNLEKKHSSITSTATYHGEQYVIKTILSGDLIHAIAAKQIDTLQSVQRFEKKNFPKNYTEYLIQNKFLSENETIIKNHSGVPYIVNQSSNQAYSISISHHGDYLGVIR